MQITNLLPVIILLAAAAEPPPSTLPSDSPRAASEAQRITSQHLPNPVRVHPKVISGGLPEDEAAFAELRDLGVKTIISVDGMRPDVVTAKKFGLRYVHLPHGYDGVPEEVALDLAKAVRDLPGPIYMHCHHGKHRSPAAATVACVAAGMLPADSARDFLTLAGTSEHYRGLYRAAERARPLDPQILDKRTPNFPEAAKLPAMAEAMVEIDHSFERMQAVAAAGWKAPPNHPDVDPAHEALILREHFTELLRSDDTARRPKSFQRMLRDSETAARQLESALNLNQRPIAPLAAKSALDKIAANCAACHKTYRDVPLGEKDITPK